MKRVLSALLSLVIMLSALLSLALIPAAAEVGDVNEISGETGRSMDFIKLDDGTDTGVKYTQVRIDGVYGNKVVHVVEADLSNTHLSIDVVNSGTYMVSAEPVASAVAKYSKDGKTVLAAVNGDLWLTNVHSNENVTTKVLKVPRGVTIVNREVWSTEQIGMENYVATNAEKGTTSPPKTAFGITADNQPLVGSPVITTVITDITTGEKITADGINRLPAWDSLIVYNNRVNDSNYALNDAYEIQLEVDDTSAFTIGGTTTATVKAIYPSKSAERPGIGEKTILLTARGKRMNDLYDFEIGDKVSFELSVVDRYGHTDMWENVVNAIGGHMTALLDGTLEQSIGGGEYPSSIIGYKDDGNVMLCTVSSPNEKTYKGLNLSQAYDFCKEMGYNSVFFLDGGGSATMVTLKKGEYTVRNQCSDGSPRSVINSVAIVWNDTPVCEKQGSLSYINVPIDLSAIPPTYIDGSLIAELMSGENQVEISYDADEKAMVMTTTGASNNDPYATVNFTELARIEAEDYPYVVIKMKNPNKTSGSLNLFFATGSRNGADGGYTKSQSFYSDDDWQYLIYDFSKDTRWKGKINNFRMDIFDNAIVSGDVSVYFGLIAFCENLEDAESIEQGWIPDGVVTDFLAYKETLKPRNINLISDPNDPNGGMIRADKSTAKAGETVTVTCSPSEDGHFLGDCEAYDENGNQIELEYVNVNNRSFIMPQSDVTVIAFWGYNPIITHDPQETTADETTAAEVTTVEDVTTVADTTVAGKSGCGGLAGGFIALTAIFACAFTFRKKD